MKGLISAAFARGCLHNRLLYFANEVIRDRRKLSQDDRRAFYQFYDDFVSLRPSCTKEDSSGFTENPPPWVDGQKSACLRIQTKEGILWLCYKNDWLVFFVHVVLFSQRLSWLQAIKLSVVFISIINSNKIRNKSSSLFHHVYMT